MIELFSAEQIRAADEYTIENESIASVDLMERAAQKCFEWIEKHIIEPKKKKQFAIFCGTGNNGGDGLVIARKLLEANQNVQVFIVELSKNYAPDFKTNLERLELTPNYLNAEQRNFEIDESAIIIDAIFGTGLSRVVEGFSAEAIEKINQQNQLTLAIDLPSGLFADEGIIEKNQCIVKADITLSFQFPKTAFLFPECGIFVGDWFLLDIGLHNEYIQKTVTSNFFVTLDDAKTILKPRNSFAHKGNFGTALIMAGSKGKVGAAVLAAKACLRSGVGLLTLQVPECTYTILQTAVPEAMVETDENPNFLTELKRDLKFFALGIGPGIGLEKETQNLLKLLIQQSSSPMVLDADALTILAENKTWLSFLPKGSILTPHIGEFKRLVGNFESTKERLKMQEEFAQKYQLYLIVKGQHTAIACPNGTVYFNSSGNPGMASGGTGDALTGILTGLLAQHYSPEQAAILGVYLHGLAGDLVAENLGEAAMLASDLIDSIGAAYKRLNH